MLKAPDEPVGQNCWYTVAATVFWNLLIQQDADVHSSLLQTRLLWQMQDGLWEEQHAFNVYIVNMEKAP